MTIADICILIAALLPYVTVAYAKILARSTFDNADPRNPKGFSGKAERAHSAHLNGFEGFPFFAVAVLFAEFRGAGQEYINMLAGAFILIRLSYVFVYVQGWAAMRSTLFVLGLLVPITLFLLPAFSL